MQVLCTALYPKYFTSPYLYKEKKNPFSEKNPLKFFFKSEIYRILIYANITAKMSYCYAIPNRVVLNSTVAVLFPKHKQNYI